METELFSRYDPVVPHKSPSLGVVRLTVCMEVLYEDVARSTASVAHLMDGPDRHGELEYGMSCVEAAEVDDDWNNQHEEIDHLGKEGPWPTSRQTR